MFAYPSYVYSMEQPSQASRLKQILMGVGVLAVIAAFIVPPLMAKDYGVHQGTFQARILSSAAGMGMAGKPVLRAQVEDETGRRFWIGVPATTTVAPDTQIIINVWCETEAHASCIGRYRRAAGGSSL